MLPALDDFHFCYRDKHHKTASSGLHPWLQDPCYCIGLCSSYENKPHMACSGDLGVILLSFDTVADVHYQPFGLIRFQVKWWLQIVLQ